MLLTNLPRTVRARGGAGHVAIKPDDVLRSARRVYVVLDVAPIEPPVASPIAGEPYTHRLRIAPVAEATAIEHLAAAPSALEHSWTWDRPTRR